MNDFMNELMTYWMNEWINEWMNEWLTKLMTEWMTEWQIDWPTKSNEWMNATNGRINKTAYWTNFDHIIVPHFIFRIQTNK